MRDIGWSRREKVKRIAEAITMKWLERDFQGYRFASQILETV
jgi:hypothetical protein